MKNVTKLLYMRYVCSCMLQALVRSKERHQKIMNVLLRKEERKRHKLKELGIDYDFPGYVSAR